MPRGTADTTRRLILKSADQLFYARGVHEVSIDQVANSAGVTKNTVYYHFPSKADLVAAYLKRRDEVTLRWLIETAESGGDQPDAQITALFDGLQQWAQSGAFSGCPFLRATSDLASARGHPALSIGIDHKDKYLDWLVNLARRAGHPEFDVTGRQLLILIDGAIADAFITNDSTLFDAAKAAATHLLDPDHT